MINCSTSLEELPSAIVWISICGGANSGKTSTFVSGIWTKPRASVAAARNSTIQRNRRLALTMERICQPPQCLPAMPSSAPQSSIAPTVTTSVPAGGPALNVTTSPSTCLTVTAERT